MRYFFPLITLWSFYFHPIFAISTLDSILSIGIPVLKIDLVDKEFPTFDIIEAPEGSWSFSITNATKVPGRMQIYLPDGTIAYDSGEYSEKKSGLTLKVRGNTSVTFNDKAQYKIKLQKKANLIGDYSDAHYNDKNWVLLYTKFQTIIGNKMNSIFGIEYTPRQQLCNFILNDSLLGSYLLSESVERNTDCRLNVDKDSGYIVERDAYWWNEPVYFNTDFFHSPCAFTFKYPDSDDVTDSQIDYIRDFINRFEASIDDGTYEKYIDVNSFAAWLLAHDLLGTKDSGGSNMYFTKRDSSDHTKLKMSTLWDFDSIFEVSEDWSPVHKSYLTGYFALLFNSPNPAFKKAFVDSWKGISPKVHDDVMNYLKDYLNSSETAGWGYEYLYGQIQNADDWFNKRILWINAEVEKMESTMPTGINTVKSQSTRDDIYNIGGQKTKFAPKGIFIINGQKYINNKY